MKKNTGLEFAYHLNNLKDKDYIEALIAFAAAPTIHKIKPSTLMRFGTSGRNTAELWRKFGNEICDEFGLEHFELKSCNNSILVLLFRQNFLDLYTRNVKNRDYLDNLGYESASDLKSKLNMLKNRFSIACPHEVGVFLGIPLEDIEGFVSNKGQNCKLCRYWKVYGDQRKAELLFKAYDKARTSIIENLLKRDTASRAS